MNHLEGLEFIRAYFDELFAKHNLAILDTCLDPCYFDDDIGDPAVDHLQNSKEYLTDLFRKDPTVGVTVVDAVTHDDVISAYLEWFRIKEGEKKVFRKGVAVFVISGRKIIKRHTFIYFEQ